MVFSLENHKISVPLHRKTKQERFKQMADSSIG